MDTLNKSLTRMLLIKMLGNKLPLTFVNLIGIGRQIQFLHHKLYHFLKLKLLLLMVKGVMFQTL